MRHLSRLTLAAVVLAAPATAQIGALGFQFFNAVKDKDWQEVNTIVSKPGFGPAVANYQPNDEAAVHVLARTGQDPYLNFVIGKGGDVNLPNRNGDTPLMLAVRYQQPSTARLLLDRRARTDVVNRQGETALTAAVQVHNAELVTLLLDAGADPDRNDNTGTSPRAYAAKDDRFPAIARLLADAPARRARPQYGPAPRRQ